MHIFAYIYGYITGQNVWIITFKYIWIITHLYYKPRIWDAHPAADFRNQKTRLCQDFDGGTSEAGLCGFLIYLQYLGCSCSQLTIYIYTYIFVYIYIYLYVYIYIYVQVYMNVQVYIYIYIYIFVRFYGYSCIYRHITIFLGALY